MPREDMPDVRDVMEGVIDADDRSARIAEHNLNALFNEGTDEDLCAGNQFAARRGRGHGGSHL
jgi:hypothetical protein